MMNFLTEETIKTIASNFNAYCADELNKLVKYKEVIIDDDDAIEAIVNKKIEVISNDFNQLLAALGPESVNLYDCRHTYMSTIKEMDSMDPHKDKEDEDDAW